ncbi:MAG: porin family protein [Gammaproteobacteria bacterium]
MKAFKRIAALGIVGLCAATAAHADDSGIYAGFSAGQAKTDFSDDVLNDVFDGKDTAFKIFGGYRILDWVGVEVGYVDLGEITQKGNASGLSRFRLEEAGFDVFGMLYWNIAPVDLFAKAGFIVSQAHVTANSLFGTFDASGNSTDLAWGVGGQVRFGKLAVRAEYERFDLDAGDGFDSPDMISVGATWTFF